MRDISTMKNLLFTLLFLLGLSVVASAQQQHAFKVVPNPNDTTNTQDVYDTPGHGKITNISNTTATIHWERHIIFNTPNIETAVCDPITCYFPGVNAKTFSLEPDSSGELTVHFYNLAYDPAPGMAGSAIVHIKLSNLGNPADTLTAVYTFSTLSATHELPAANVKVFPNPTTEYFTLENAEDVGMLRLYTIDGREVAHFEAVSNQTYSIANQPVGNYVLSFEDKKGNLFQALELHKR